MEQSYISSYNNYKFTIGSRLNAELLSMKKVSQKTPLPNTDTEYCFNLHIVHYIFTIILLILF